MEMATVGYINKTEILQYIYSWPNSGPTQQQLIFFTQIGTAGAALCVLKNVVLHLSQLCMCYNSKRKFSAIKGILMMFL